MLFGQFRIHFLPDRCFFISPHLNFLFQKSANFRRVIISQCIYCKKIVSPPNQLVRVRKSTANFVLLIQMYTITPLSTDLTSNHIFFSSFYRSNYTGAGGGGTVPATPYLDSNFGIYTLEERKSLIISFLCGPSLEESCIRSWSTQARTIS